MANRGKPEMATNDSERAPKLSRMRFRDRSLDSLRSQLSNISPKLQRALEGSPSSEVIKLGLAYVFVLYKRHDFVTIKGVYIRNQYIQLFAIYE